MQAIAVLHDSLRYLRSQSLFWIALALSAVVAIALFGLLDFTPTGWRVLWLAEKESEILREGTYGSRMLLSWLFGGAFVFWWLSWGAIIVALISTASIMPDFAASGSIDLTVSKPIGRAKLFLLKVTGSTLFMLLQVTVGVVLAYLLMGFRFGMWFHGALWAIPLLVLQFLYLYAVLALAGLVTRSTLASLIIALVFWFIIFLVQFSASQVDKQMGQSTALVERAEIRMAEIRDRAYAENRELRESEERQLQKIAHQADMHRSAVETIRPWQSRTSMMRLFVPKTGDVQRIVANLVEAPTFTELMLALQGFDEEAVSMVAGLEDPMAFRDMQVGAAAGERAMREVSTTTSIATSLLFTAAVLGLSTLIFRRRDF
jgi:ABC-type transport system involved in multi-copper enzyme maturation permease subunit